LGTKRDIPAHIWGTKYSDGIEQDDDKNPRCVTYLGFTAKDEIFLKE